MRVLGLTGSIGMGKTTAARMLRQDRVPVHDADATIHRLLAPGGAGVAAVEAAFPGVRRDDGAIDRSALGARVFGDPAALRRLEAILHPLARAATVRFLGRMRRQRRPVVVLDVPLLFETGGERLCDAVAVVSASAMIQCQRVMRRPGMTKTRFRAILARQMPDREKRRRADYVILTGLGFGRTRSALRRAVASIVAGDGRGR